MHLQNENNVRIMFLIFDQYRSLGPIELDIFLIIFVKVIRSRMFDEIVTYMFEFEEEIINLFDL